MKNFVLALLLVVSTGALMAQPAATEGRVEFQKSNKVAALLELPYPPEIVEKAISDNMMKKGIKQESIKGFSVYKGARLSTFDTEVNDLYFKIDRKSRKDKNESVIYMIVGRANENLGIRTDADAYKLTDGKTFLNELIPSIESYNLEVNIKDQEEKITKAEKKLRDLQEDQVDIEKKIRGLQDKLAENRKNQDAQNAELNTQRSARDAMNARRVAAPAN
jgi:hypothetical protein